MCIGNLTGTATKRVEVDASSSTINAANQKDAAVKLVVDGTQDKVVEGAGKTVLENMANTTAAEIIAAMQKHLAGQTATILF